MWIKTHEDDLVNLNTKAVIGLLYNPKLEDGHQWEVIQFSLEPENPSPERYIVLASCMTEIEASEVVAALAEELQAIDMWELLERIRSK